jgi:pyrroline-5-carboxylate reductase
MTENNVLEMQKIAFIGAGNMAEALISGIIEESIWGPRNILITDIRPERLDELEDTYGVQPHTAADAIAAADIIVLAVKPQQLPDLLQDIASEINLQEQCILSIAAGVKTVTIEDALGEGARVVRAMPNTPALVGHGAAALCGGQWAREEDLERAEIMLKAVGMVAQVDETDMDAVTAVSGSGPAYVFYLIEAMQAAAEELGLEADKARELILATVTGAAKLCEETQLSASQLRQRVTSKGGTTAAALAVLEEKGVGEILQAAIKAARDRSIELSAGA